MSLLLQAETEKELKSVCRFVCTWCVCACVCVGKRERESNRLRKKEMVQPILSFLAHCLSASIVCTGKSSGSHCAAHSTQFIHVSHIKTGSYSLKLIAFTQVRFQVRTFKHHLRIAVTTYRAGIVAVVNAFSKLSSHIMDL